MTTYKKSSEKVLSRRSFIGSSAAMTTFVFLPPVITVFKSIEEPGKIEKLPAEEYEIFVQENVMVEMRDGIKLATDIYFPAV